MFIIFLKIRQNKITLPAMAFKTEYRSKTLQIGGFCKKGKIKIKAGKKFVFFANALDELL
ncbi:MAG: hypothetical protein WC868_02700 [Bacteroidales bacterium]